jgi:hypothetical protein
MKKNKKERERERKKERWKLTKQTCRSLSMGTCLMATNCFETLCIPLITEPYELVEGKRSLK